MWGCIYFVVFVQRKKKKSEIKRRNKFLKEKKNRKERKKKKLLEREIPKIELFCCIVLFSIKGWRRIRKLFRVEHRYEFQSR